MPQPVRWPSAGDYSSAIQNPQNCFDEPDLRLSSPEKSRLGLPAAASGNFAVVYRLHAGASDVALRCFIRPVSDQRRRYDELSRHLGAVHLPFLVKFAYVESGIRVQGAQYPIVRMDWISGDQLHKHVERNVGSPAVLSQLAAEWRGILGGLRGTG